MIKNLWYRFWDFLKRAFSNLKERAKPRKTFQWILTAVIWVIVIVYIGVGIYFGVLVYKYHSESKATKFAVKIYPFPAAVVNSSIVWSKNYYEQLNYIEQFSAKTKQPLPDKVALRNQIVDQLIENKLLEIQAARYHISVTSKDVNDAYQKIVDQSGGSAEVKKVLTELYGMSEKDFKGLIRQQVLKQKIQDQLIMQVQAAHILIKDQNTANDVAARAKKGEDFAALAKQYSEDTKSNTAGGELGWLSRGQFVVNNVSIPEFDNAAFAAKKGDIVGPVQTSIGFEIIKVEDKKGTIDKTYDSWLADLKKQAKIWKQIK
jgi:foldase protein PrsA